MLPYVKASVVCQRQAGPKPAARSRYCGLPAGVAAVRRRVGWKFLVAGRADVFRDCRLAYNAMIVSLLAYAGLRPVEDRGARWGDVRDRTLRVAASKTGRVRHIDLLAPLAQDGASRVEARLGATRRHRADRPQADGRRVDRVGFGQLAQADLAAGGDQGRGNRRPAPLPAPGLVRVASALGR